MRRYTARFFAICLALGAAACSPSTEIHSSMAGDYDQNPKRILIIETMGRLPLNASFNENFARLMSKCGEQVSFFRVNTPPANRYEQETRWRSFAPTIRKFADATLEIDLTNMKMWTIFGSSMGDNEYEYAFQLEEPEGRQLWHSHVDLTPASLLPGFMVISDTQSLGLVLARDSFDQMQQDGLFTCDLPKRKMQQVAAR